MAYNLLQQDYERKRREYHNAGRACKGTAPNSPERQRYADAKEAYAAAGEVLRRSRVKA